MVGFDKPAESTAIVSEEYKRFYVDVYDNRTASGTKKREGPFDEKATAEAVCRRWMAIFNES